MRKNFFFLPCLTLAKSHIRGAVTRFLSKIALAGAAVAVEGLAWHGRSLPATDGFCMLSGESAAAYAGLDTTKFDELVRTGDMPKPVVVGGSALWDRWKVDQALTKLVNEVSVSPWEQVAQPFMAGLVAVERPFSLWSAHTEL